MDSGRENTGCGSRSVKSRHGFVNRGYQSLADIRGESCRMVIITSRVMNTRTGCVSWRGRIVNSWSGAERGIYGVVGRRSGAVGRSGGALGGSSGALGGSWEARIHVSFCRRSVLLLLPHSKSYVRDC